MNRVADFLPGEENGEKTPPPPPKAKPLCDLQARKQDDPLELIKNGFLCRGGSVLLCGPTGIGKSSFAMQAAILWSLGEPIFGIVPARPLKSLIVQSENDEGDLFEMKAGVLRGLRLSEADCRRAEQSVLVCQESERAGRAFTEEVLEPLLVEEKPELLWIDPALAYLGGNAKEQVDVSRFLRGQLNPVLHRHGCGCFLLTHTNKPPSGREKSEWSGSDFAYLGTGSIEWANWARAVLAIRSLGTHNVFELKAAKRGSRLGWRNPDDTPCFDKLIGHWREPGVICWREIDGDEAPNKIGGRPKKANTNDLLSVLPGAGLTATEWQSMAEKEQGISRALFYQLKRELVVAERVTKSVTSDKWQPLLKRK